MHFILNLFIWIRKNFIRILLREYPNKLLTSSVVSQNSSKKYNLVSSSDNFWVSQNMYKKWDFYSKTKDLNLYLYSNYDVNSFMKNNFKDDLIYEIYLKSYIPVQKIDIFRICFILKYGGIWLDLKSEINIMKTLNLFKNCGSNGILLCEDRKIDVINDINGNKLKSHEKVIHNGFFFLPKNSIYLKNIIEKIKNDFLYFQDVRFFNPKQAIMNLTGPHQFTRSYYDLEIKNRPKLVFKNDIDWIYCSKFGEFISPFKKPKHYSFLKNLKTIDSNKFYNLKT